MIKLELIGQGKRNKVYRDGDAAVKVYANAQLDSAKHEEKMLLFTHASGLPVPAVYGLKEMDGDNTGLYMQRISGRTILRGSEAQMQEDVHALAALHKAIHDIPLDPSAQLPDITATIRRGIENSHYLEDEAKKKLLAHLARYDDGHVCFCHWGLHGNNVMFDGEKYWLIDWHDAGIGHPFADVCKTYINTLGHLPEQARLYLELYCQSAQVRSEEVLTWLPFVAATRLGHVPDAMRITLLAFIKEAIT